MILNILKKHPFFTAAGISLFLCGSAMAAFSIAPVDDKEQIQSMLTQVEANITLDHELQQQTALLTNHALSLFRNGYTQTTDTPQALFERMGISDSSALDFMRKDPLARLILNSGKRVRVTAEVASDNSLINLNAYLPSKEKRHFQRISIERSPNNQLQSVSYTVPVEVHERIASGKIKYSLLGATESINLPTNVAYQFIDIFESRIDFSRQLRAGDTFQLVYESFEADGHPIGTGKILAAQFVNSGKKYNAMWFAPEDQNFRNSYLTFDGKSLRTTFLAYPLEYTRISSQFGRRLHPIHGTWRNHSGIDYAAPTGTPIRTLGDGRVTFAGTKGGYGKVVIVEHSRGRTTLYAHMSKIIATTGQILEQGDIIGEVGQTGWATGPHLHLEFRENGDKKDPAILAKHTETQEMSDELTTLFTEEAQINSELIERIARLSLIDKPEESNSKV